MLDKSMRAIGATVVLFGIAVAAIMQVGPGGASSAISLASDDPVIVESTTGETSSPEDSTTVVAPDPFTYRVGVLAGVSTDNFWAFYGAEPSVWNSYILGPTKPALFNLDATGSLRPEIATGEVSPTFDKNGWRVRVDLNDAYRWSDGTPITADDIVFTFETVRSLNLGGSWADVFPDTVESIHADSPLELRIEFTQRPTLAVWPNAVGMAPVMASHVWRDVATGSSAADLYANSGLSDVGGGPLTLTLVEADRVVSVANPGYGLNAGPDTVEYQVFDSEDAALSALNEGLIDTILSPKGLTAAQAATLADDPRIAVSQSPANGVRYIGFNLKREPMSDLAFRKALALLLDRDEIAEEINVSGGAAYAFVSDANTTWYNETAALKNASKYSGTIIDRLEEAVQGLVDVGYGWQTPPSVDNDGKVVPGVGLTIGGLEPAPLTILTPGDTYDSARPEYAAEIAATLGWLGFDVRPVETDFDTVIDLAFTPDEEGALHYDMYLLGWTLGNPLLPNFYRPLFAADGEMNNTGYANNQFGKLLADYENAYSVEDAREALWAMEKRLTNDLPYLLLYRSEIVEVYRSDNVTFDTMPGLGGLQGILGGVTQVKPAS